MHGPNDNYPILIVLGLTGPFGSGCSLLSTVFDGANDDRRQGNWLLRWLVEDKLLIADRDLSNIKVSYKRTNDDIAGLYKNRESIKSELEKLKNNQIQYDYNIVLSERERKWRDNFDEISSTLEKREAYHSLEFLERYYKDSDHLFRTISFSDQIVLRAIMESEGDDFSIDQKCESYKDFYEVFNNDKEKLYECLSKHGYKDITSVHNVIQGENPNKEAAEAYIEIIQPLKAIKDKLKEKKPKQYTDILQDFGNNLRCCGFASDKTDTFDNNHICILAKDISNIIRTLYKNELGAFFVLDSIRNPYEGIFLRHEFANFYFVSVFANKDTRKKKIIAQCGDLDKAEQIEAFRKADLRDSGKGIQTPEEQLYKQNIEKCVQISDISITNNKEDANARHLYEKIIRYLCLILSPGCTKPTRDEMFMNMAYTMAVKSNCICRQVGAVIVGKDGYIIGAGYNDVGEDRISCGLREINDLQYDEFEAIRNAIMIDEEMSITDKQEQIRSIVDRVKAKCGKDDMCFCFKDFMANKKTLPKLENSLEQIFKDEEGSDDNLAKHKKRLKTLVENSSLHQLECCLSLHAEENAILQNAKVGGVSMQEGTIYTTLHPCPLCAKKIQQIGIKKVVYTDPYPAGLSEVYLHGVKQKQFEGVKPRAYIKLFMPNDEQKEWQNLVANEIVPKC